MENGKRTRSKHYHGFFRAARQGRANVEHDVSCDQYVIFLHGNGFLLFDAWMYLPVDTSAALLR